MAFLLQGIEKLTRPLYTAWYGNLDRIMMRLKLSGLATKVAMDLFIFDPPYLSVFFLMTNDVKTFRERFPTTYFWDIVVWAPIQTINFRFFKPVWQPLVVNVVNIAWNAYLSIRTH